MEDETKPKTPKTILHFIFVHDEKAKLNDYFEEISFSNLQKTFIFKIPKDKINDVDKDNNIHDKVNDFEDKTFVDVSKSNDIELVLKVKENVIRFEESIHFKRLDNLPSISLDYPIYINKINNIYIDSLNKDEKSIISLEILYQTIKPELLPEKINYRGKELKCFDTFNNKLRKRISLANIIPDEFDFMRNIKNNYSCFKFENKTTYQILVIIPNEEKAEYSIAKNEFDSSESSEEEGKKIKIGQEEAYNKLMKFKVKFNNVSINGKFEDVEEIKPHIEDFDDDFKSLKMEIAYYDNMSNYKDFKNIDIEIFILLFYYFEYLTIKKLIDDGDEEEKDNIILMLYSASDFNKIYEKYINEIKKLNMKIEDKLLLIKTYNKKFIDCFRSRNSIDYISVIDLSKDKPFYPYHKAVNFIKDIILGLKEDSRLFEIFLYLDSDIIKNLLIEREKNSEKITDIYGDKQLIEYDKNPTEYGINMMNIDEVRSHLLKLIPEYIVRIDSSMEFNPTYDNNTKIMILNERQLFQTSSKGLNNAFENNIFSNRFVLPIIMEILQEMFGHGKRRLLDKNALSPEEYRDSKHNYERKSINKKVETSKEIIYPESGIVLEHYISENKNIIKWLKKLHPNEQGQKILNVSLWVDNNFNDLEKIVEEYMSKSDKYKNKDSDSLYSTTKNECDFIDYEEDTCGFHRFDNNNY